MESFTFPVAGGNRVESPVDEETELVVAKPLETLVFGGLAFGIGGSGLHCECGHGAADIKQHPKTERTSFGFH